MQVAGVHTFFHKAKKDKRKGVDAAASQGMHAGLPWGRSWVWALGSAAACPAPLPPLLFITKL